MEWFWYAFFSGLLAAYLLSGLLEKLRKWLEGLERGWWRVLRGAGLLFLIPVYTLQALEDIVGGLAEAAHDSWWAGNVEKEPETKERRVTDDVEDKVGG